MNDHPTGQPNERLNTFAGEVLRWNRQINLVSRVDSRARVAALIAQCRIGWRLTAEALDGQPWLTGALYVDLGSGAGLPGLVWAEERRVLHHQGPNVLVEPRDKRAWFLKRTARLLEYDHVSVVAARWGEAPLPVDAVSDVPAVLISLKALKLDDGEILGGLDESWPACPVGCRVAVVRFLDPKEHTRAWLEDRFAWSEPADHARWYRGGVEVLGAGDPRLLITHYSRH